MVVVFWRFCYLVKWYCHDLPRLPAGIDHNGYRRTRGRHLTFRRHALLHFNSRSPSSTRYPQTSFNMAFILRRPFTLASAIKQTPKNASKAARTFHNSPIKSNTFTSRSTSPTTALVKSRNAFQSSFRRAITQDSPIPRPDQGSLGQRLLYGGAIVGGTLLATNLLFNRETREDGGMPPYERAFLNETFLHTGLGIGIIGVAAQALHRSGWSYRLMMTNPWLVVGGSLALSIGTMYGTFNTDPNK